jgi:PHD/YefM family antitoxin component YafN of YafNO toxin-antitoxin module
MYNNGHSGREQAMIVNTDKMVSVTQLQRELAKKLRDVPETKEPLFVMRNNRVAAVMLSPGEYAALKDMEEVLEHFKIFEMVRQRMEHHDPSQAISLEALKERYGL